MSRKLTTEEFIAKAKQVHGNKYDYSKVKYKNMFEKVCIICPTHGEFWKDPKSHLKGQGCPKCGLEKRAKTHIIDIETIKKKCFETHGDKYKYKWEDYKGIKKQIEITCPIHGTYKQVLYSHIKGCGCPECGKNSLTQDEVKIKLENIFKGKYIFNVSNYVNEKSKINVYCPKHGWYQKTADNLFKGCICKQCSDDERRSNTDEFIEKARKIHGEKYNYSNVEYFNNLKRIKIICPIHGEFFQTPSNHLLGYGCKKCSSSKLEEEIRNFLKNNVQEDFIEQYNNSWLGRKTLDFFIPSKKIAIECQGRQHFFSIDVFGGETEFKRQIERDTLKKHLCEEHGITLLYYSNLHIDYPYKVFEDKEELLKEIKLHLGTT